MEPWIQTFTGLRVNPLELRPDDIRIEDIAHALSCVNRFAGHAVYPINVAQHSIMVSRLADPGYELQGLLHDASEAYLGDMTKWLKMAPEMKFYREIEDRAQHTIFKKFGCPEEMHPSVETADRLMVRFEATKAFGPRFVFPHPDYPPPTEVEMIKLAGWRQWSWKTSREVFNVEYHSLRPDSD